MKQSVLSYLKTEKKVLLEKSMTENSKNACWLLVSVILLVGTVTGIANPLERSTRHITDQVRFMQKEILLYREFAGSADREQRQTLQRNLLQNLEKLMPDQISVDDEVQRIYRLAGYRSITVKFLKQIPDSPVPSKTTVNRINRLLWETELFGNWYDLVRFFNDIETQGPCTRIDALQIRKSDGTRKEVILSGTGISAMLSVRGRICVYHSCKKPQL